MARYESQIDLLKISAKGKEPVPAKNESPLFKYVGLLIIIMIATAIGFYFYPKAPAPPPPSAPPPPAPAAVVQPPPPLPTPPPPEKPSPPLIVQPEKEKEQPEKVAPAKAPPKDEGQPKERRHILKVIALEKTWLRIKPDNEPVIDVLLQPKETASWSARRGFDITVGNAGGIEIYFNGVSQGRLGKSGDVVNLVLPRENPPPKAVTPGQPKPSPEEKERMKSPR
jgi:hypothetical protein